MKEEVSSGIIPFRTTRGKIEYLILKSRTKDWEFPKGSIENDEELQQTALREITEETGIEEIRLLNGFRKDYDYIFEFNGETIHKTVHLFLGHSYEATAELSKEHHDLQWQPYERTRSTLSHESTKNILDEAHQYLIDNGYDDLE